MKFYATLLNLAEANTHALRAEEIFEPVLQKDILSRMLWGSGKTKDDSLKCAMIQLVRSGVFETFECEECAQEIIKNNGGKDALRHLWLHDAGYEVDPKLSALPTHEVLVDFCNRFGLPEEAKQELAGFFDAAVHIDSQFEFSLAEEVL